MIIINKLENNVLIRDLRNDDKDIQMLFEWLNKEEVSKYYGDSNEKSFEFVKNKYITRLQEENMYPCIIENNNIPIGYIQFYVVNEENYDLTEEQFKMISENRNKIYAIDVFLSGEEYRNKGLGTVAIKMLTNIIFEKYGADRILIDPKTHNERAIKCYEKCGFKRWFIAEKREEQNGILYDNLIMRIDCNDKDCVV